MARITRSAVNSIHLLKLPRIDKCNYVLGRTGTAKTTSPPFFLIRPHLAYGFVAIGPKIDCLLIQKL